MKRSKLTKILLGATLPALLAFGAINSATAQTNIVFVAPVTVKVNRTSTTYAQIFSMNANGGGVVQLTSANVSASCPRWSPGQKYIAFNRNGTLYVMKANGGGTFAVAPASVGGCDWSPDGTKLVYEGPMPGDNLYIVSVDAATGRVGAPVLFQSGEYSNPSWSPDGTRIAFWGSEVGSEPFWIYVCDVATGAEISCFGVSDPAAAPGFSNETPQWSPDGSLIAFSGPVTWVTTEGVTNTANEIFTANADGTGITRQTFLESYTLFPTWSPDGTAIAFRSDVSGRPSVYKMVLGRSPAKNKITLLYSDGNAPDWNPSNPVWP
jgi:Tol biopolymer transport system component